MSKVIIGIHGLANKPEKNIHRNGWINAMAEGLKNINDNFKDVIDFEDVYWAQYLYKYTLHSDHNFSFDELYDDEPYYKAEQHVLKAYEDGWADETRAFIQRVSGSLLDLGKKARIGDTLSSFLISRILKDLDFYYNDNKQITGRDGQKKPTKSVLKDELKHAILKHKDSEITIIAHSMGSIIAYDVLRDMYKDYPDIAVNHFITVGSPLGIPYVKNKIESERADRKVRTPSIIKKTWVNYSDRNDPVAFDTHLSDDYGANANAVQVKDDLVFNDYVSPITKKENPHKIYGYLRCPELSTKLNNILDISRVKMPIRQGFHSEAHSDS